MAARFEWDPVKAASNERKHGLTFEIAARVFTDPFAVIEQDRIENGEQRWRAIGMVDGSMLIFVAYATWDNDNEEVVRIVSARRPTRHERKRYEQDG